MGRPYWATDPQWTWLVAKAIVYMSIKTATYATKQERSKAFKVFWANYFEEWTRQWPNPGLTAVVKEEPLSDDELSDNDTPEKEGEDRPPQKHGRKKKEPLTVRVRLRQWINNHTRPAKGEGKPVKLDLSGKTKPKWQAYQAYSYLYYDTRLRAVIVPEYTTYLAGLAEETKPESLFMFRNRRLRELLELEPDDVKSAVEEFRQKSPTLKDQETLERMMGEGLSEAAAKEAVRTARIHALPDAIANTMDQILEQTDMMGFVMLMGRNPNAPNEVMTMLYQSGRTANGLSFKETYREFDTAIRGPLDAFARKCIFVDRTVGETPSSYTSPDPPDLTLGEDASTARTADVANAPSNTNIPATSSTINSSTDVARTEEPVRVQDGANGDIDEPSVAAEDDDSDSNTDTSSVAAEDGTSASKKIRGARQQPQTKQYRISEYELEREENIERNKKLFESMGLDVFTKELEMGLTNPGKKGKNKSVKKGKSKSAKKPSKPTDRVAAMAKARAVKASKAKKTHTKRSANQTKAAPSQNEDTDMVGVEVEDALPPVPTEPNSQTEPNPQTDLNASANLHSSSPASESAVNAQSTPATSTGDWMMECREALDKVFMSSVGKEMLEDWIRFEVIMGPQDPKKTKLTKRSRPQPLEDWLSRPRRHNINPPIGTPLEYGTAWCAWWRSMQPRWRREGAMAGDMALIRRQVDDENWLNVAKAGANGIVLALVSLSWWSLGAKGDSDRQWCSDAVDDVAWVLKQLVRRFTKPEEEVDDIDEEGAHRGRKSARPPVLISKREIARN
ncbi:hypothetical protein FIBSPDRAFT_988802 [Athelia psychrophila]|uniref:Uncharacterized protein n=1 Tax=Athelia psychrophila TaxID=1759441 RepID=A0A166SIY8_9AGAM|nr:hypothetical protein FIBSPDRAFT_988802 [Fibularhizoctonia sp. CBS 109695]